ncbi:iron ABC transporter ATP-binding protein [Streptococcus moroccensis]|uniref:Iron complex transport system ATP-binding protein n=1 Tax=Streptococcus moroccensis TaxID=1451356 RepID=A0ABT9YUQ2_9STRE|nr:ATP-binding cassette domain-containing protein [Streptococcus moroccensis]MDQ0223083.1 iron complex transport system ATP-binding protein [Streptococcus moroccensis]
MKLEAISKHFGDEAVLIDISMEVPSGSFTAFIGPNGAGKSSLINIMSRLLPKESGYLWIKGQEIEAWDHKALARELSLLKQSQHYHTRLRVEELVSFGRFPYSGNRLTEEDQTKIQEAIAYMGLEGFKDRYIHTLSGGQLQRVYIAMVLAQDTDIILLDEPLNNLDMKQSIAMMTILRKLVDDLGKTVVIVIHDINIASRYVYHMVAFKDGQVFESGPTATVMTKSVLDKLYDMSVRIVDIDGKQHCIY